MLSLRNLRVLVRPVLVSAFVLSMSLGASACKQGSGDRCQIDDDCSGDLICTNLGFCGTQGQNIGDAAPLPDGRADGAEAVDAEPADAHIDAAPTDAAVDAQPDAS